MFHYKGKDKEDGALAILLHEKHKNAILKIENIS